MNRLLLACIFLFTAKLSLAQDPLHEIDPARVDHGRNVERQLPRKEIPGTLRETQEDHIVTPLDGEISENSFDPVLSRDTATMKFLDKHGNVIRDPFKHTRERSQMSESPERKQADTLEYFPNAGSRPPKPDSIFSKP